MTAPFVVVPRTLIADVLACLAGGDTAQARQLAEQLEERVDVADRRVAGVER